jgi:hypothetical protein
MKLELKRKEIIVPCCCSNIQGITRKINKPEDKRPDL